MKTMKRLGALLLAAVMTVGLVACGGNNAGNGNNNNAPQNGGDAATGEKTYKIGVVQLREHVALDAAYEGFVEALDESGIKYEIDLKNAQGEEPVCSTIVTKFINDKVDLILAIATPAAQAAAQATTEIPILVTAVTDPAQSGLVESNEKPGRNVSGTSDLNPVEAQINLLKQLVPEAKTIGIMYCSGEDNSILQEKMARAAAEAVGLAVETYTVSDGNDIPAVTQSMVGKVDALYVPTDNLLAESMALVAQVTNPNKIPVICGEEGMVETGGLATYGISYKQLGRQTGEQAVKILRDGADITTMPIEYCSEDLSIAINQQTADAIGITIPDDLKAQAK